jgi:hypothetical protein
MKTECDCCNEYWEDSFFCKECSGYQEYEFHGGQDYYWNDVCLNCCTCHMQSACYPINETAENEDSDVPF